MVWLPLRGFSSICASVPLLGGFPGEIYAGRVRSGKDNRQAERSLRQKTCPMPPKLRGAPALIFPQTDFVVCRRKIPTPSALLNETQQIALNGTAALCRESKPPAGRRVAAPSGVPVFAIGIRPSRYPGMFFRSSALVGYLRMKNRRRSMASIGLWPARPRRMTLILCSSSGVRRSSSRRVPERKMSTAG
jgi:hypothetical protein